MLAYKLKSIFLSITRNNNNKNLIELISYIYL